MKKTKNKSINIIHKHNRLQHKTRDSDLETNKEIQNIIRIYVHIYLS